MSMLDERQAWRLLWRCAMCTRTGAAKATCGMDGALQALRLRHAHANASPRCQRRYGTAGLSCRLDAHRIRVMRR